MFCLIINAESSRLLEVFPEENLEKHGMRYSEVMWKERKSAKTQLKTEMCWNYSSKKSNPCKMENRCYNKYDDYDHTLRKNKATCANLFSPK